MIDKGLKNKINLELDVVKLVRIDIEPLKKLDRKKIELSKVNPKVTSEEAVKALRSMKGGAEIIEMLKKEGKKI